MRQFSYKQCDKAHQKLNKFNQVLNKYSSSVSFHSKFSPFNSNNKQNECDSHFLPAHTPKNSYGYKKCQESSYYSIHDPQCKNTPILEKSRKFNLQQFNSNIKVRVLDQRSENIQEKMKNEFFKRQQVSNLQRLSNKNKNISNSSHNLIEKQQSQSTEPTHIFELKKQKNITRQKSIDQIDNQINSIMSKYKYDSQQKIQNSFSNKSFLRVNDKSSQIDQAQPQKKELQCSGFRHFDNSFQNQNNKHSQNISNDRIFAFQLAKDGSVGKLCQSKYVKKGRSFSNIQEKFKHQFFQKEINVINQKIKKVQQKKKKLKIQFLPFNYQSSKKYNEENSQSQKQTKFKQLLQNYRTLQKCQNYQTGNSQTQKQKTNQYSTISFHEANSQIQQIQDNYKQVTLNIQQKQPQQKITFIQKQIKQKNSVKNSKAKLTQNLFQQSNSQKQQLQKNSNNMNRSICQTNTCISNNSNTTHQNKQQHNPQNQKKLAKNKTQKKLNRSVILVKQQNVNQLEKLLTALHMQIQLDQQLRSEKIKFQYIQDQSKWNILFLELKKSQIIMNFQAMKDIFTCTINEHNPFLKFKKNQIYQNYKTDNKTCIKHLILKFKEAQNFWNNKICGQFVEHKLYQYRFNEYSLDLQSKNHIAVQDLVRFINMSLNTQYRNRDLILIFNRCLGKNQKQLKFGKFIKIMTQINFLSN